MIDETRWIMTMPAKLFDAIEPQYKFQCMLICVSENQRQTLNETKRKTQQLNNMYQMLSTRVTRSALIYSLNEHSMRLACSFISSFFSIHFFIECTNIGKTRRISIYLCTRWCFIDFGVRSFDIVLIDKCVCVCVCMHDANKPKNRILGASIF